MSSTSTLWGGTPSSRTTASVIPRTTPAFCSGVRPGYMCIVTSGICRLDLRVNCLTQSERRDPQPAATAQVEVDDLSIVEQLFTAAVHTVLAHVEHITMIGHRQTLARLLLDHHRAAQRSKQAEVRDQCEA